jgi:hypothetical protein
MHGLPARIVSVGWVAAIALLGSTPGFAQYGPGIPNSSLTNASQHMRGGNAGAPAKPEVAAPPVLPGTKKAPEAAAPAESTANLSPTDALFDAINRGDLPAARDAVNRGAELTAVNVLGLTPLELSVDLGRNDISFMLLSMRDEDASSRATARNGGEPAGAVFRAGATPATKVVSHARVAAAYAQAPEEPVAAAPRVYSGNGGSPIPAAGFLGFGTVR